MCGIFGYYSATGASPHDLEIMDRALRHRGPDDRGSEVFTVRSRAENSSREFSVGLGHRRLSIIDLSNAGRQPMASYDGRYIISYNGELYNYCELRGELANEGYVFASRSDTEVVLAAWAIWGEECLRRFIGMFAFAIHDRKSGVLFLVRDPFGIKPLYIYKADSDLVFASEIKAIRAVRRIGADEESIFHYLAGGAAPDPCRSFYAEVRLLEPGHLLEVDRGEMRQKPWYSRPAPPARLGAPGDHYTDSISEFTRLFHDSVAFHMTSDVPVGFCLSGGLDSSSVVSSAVKMNSIADAKTFSAVFPGKLIDESQWVEAVVADLDVDSFRVTPSAESALDHLEALCRTQDEPIADWSLYLQWCVMRKVHEEKIKVVLDGQGADELLSGYATGLQCFLTQVRTERGEEEYLRMLAEFRKNTHYPFLHRSGSSESGTPENQDDGFPILEEGFFRRFTGTGRRLASDFSSVDAFLAHQFFDSSLPRLLLWEDRSSMAFSVEARVPFVTSSLVDFVFSRPGDFKFREGWTKWPLRRGLEATLHDRIRWRKDKLGYTAPNEDWLLANRSGLLNIIADRGELGGGFLNVEGLLKRGGAQTDRRALHKIFRAAALLIFLDISGSGAINR